MPLPSPAPAPLEGVPEALASLAAATPSPLQHFTLENGLSVYLRQQHGTSLAAVQLWYHVGTSHEPAGHTNLSHLLEHLIFEGSSKLAAGDYSRVVARLGGRANASTRLDATAYEISLPVTRLPVALEIMADAMHSATFDASDLARAAKAIVDERRLKLDTQPAQQALDHHQALAHGNSPYAAPSFGNAADLGSLDLQQLRTWYRTWYRPSNATLVVVGDIDLATLRGPVDKYFSPLISGPVTDCPAPRHDDALQARTHTVSLPGLAHGLFMSFNVPGCATAPDETTTAALELIGELLGQGASSWLYSELVRDQRVLTGVRVNYDPLVRGDTLLTVAAYVNTTHATPEQAAEAVYQKIDQLRSLTLTSSELQHLKLGMLARRLFTLEDPASQAERIGSVAAAGQPASLVDSEAARLVAIDATTLQQVANTYLGRERLTITFLRPGAQA
ncbi:insulinase family protein [Pseudomonas sp. S36]|nr:insulinase family protein [Pseudomonas sp. S36]